MLVQSMSRMMETIGPKFIHGVRPDRPVRTDGRAKDVYDQMRDEFFVAGPFVLHGEVPSLLAAAWTVVRETLFVGEADRGRKEAIAWAVSQGNQCPFCVDAHGAARSAAQTTDSALERWARASASADETASVQPPDDLDRYRAEYLGTLTAFHYLNRMVSVFLDDKMMPVPNALGPMTRSMAKVMMSGMMDKADGLTPGDSLALLPEHDTLFAWRPGWAADSPNVLSAMAGWSAVIEAEAAERFAPTLLAVLNDRFSRWRGETQLKTFTDMEPLARLAVLTVEAPYRVSDADVAAAIAASSTADTLTMVAWAAQKASRRCAGWANLDSQPLDMIDD